MKGNFKILLLILLGSTALQGCIRYNESDLDCDRTRVVFRYYGDIPGESRFLQKTDRVDLFVYDADGKLVETFSKEKADLASHAGININLPDGEYELVAWTNLSDDTKVLNRENLAEAVVGCSGYLSSSTGEVRDRENDRIYFSRKSITVIQSQFREEVMEFDQSHVPLRVYISNAGSVTRAASPVEIAIRNVFPQMSFDGHCLQAVKGTYYPPLHYDEATGDWVCTLNAYRFSDQNELQIELLNSQTQNSYKSVDLVDFMTENSISVDGTREPEVGIRFRFATTGVEIQPWDEENIDPGVN